MADSRDDIYASAGKVVVVERAATDAAFKLVKSGRDAYHGRRDAVWRARRDGVVEVARGERGRVELYEVYNDGIAHLVAQSRRSVTKVAANLCGFAAVASVFVGVLGAIFVSEGFIALAVALMMVLSLLTLVLRWTSDVRPWLRAQFGSDGDWSQVPWKIEGTPTTGNQTLALTAIADDREVRYRVVADGTLEAVIRVGKQVEVLAIDRYGVATVTETLPSKRFNLYRLRGADTNWHRVITLDPTD